MGAGCASHRSSNEGDLGGNGKSSTSTHGFGRRSTQTRVGCGWLTGTYPAGFSASPALLAALHRSRPQPFIVPGASVRKDNG